MKQFTEEDMIRFLYNEMNAEETQQFLQAMQQNWTMKEAFENLKQSKDCLNAPLASPRKSTVNAILQYAELSEGVTH
jgi:phosphopantetheinyl transferase